MLNNIKIMTNSKNISELYCGEFIEENFEIHEKNIKKFGTITGDLNPIHFDDEYAGNTIFKGKIVHGMLIAGYISKVIGMQLPGLGTIYQAQNLEFLAPVRYGDTVKVRVEVIGMEPMKNRVKLSTKCYCQDKLVIDGTAIVLPRRK